MIVPAGPQAGAGGAGGPAPTRQVALIIWSALLAGVSIFAVVATVVGPTGFWGRNDAVADPLTAVVVGMALVCFVASRLVPPRVKPVPGAPPEGVAVTKTILASALNEGAGLFATVVWMTTGAALALVALAISVAGILLAFPSEARWRRLCSLPEAGAPANRLVR